MSLEWRPPSGGKLPKTQLSVTYLSCQLSVCLVSKSLDRTNRSHSLLDIPALRPYRSSQGVSTAEGIIHMQIRSSVTPNTMSWGWISTMYYSSERRRRIAAPLLTKATSDASPAQPPHRAAAVLAIRLDPAPSTCASDLCRSDCAEARAARRRRGLAA